jgi:hypothetical protein
MHALHDATVFMLLAAPFTCDSREQGIHNTYNDFAAGITPPAAGAAVAAEKQGMSRGSHGRTNGGASRRGAGLNRVS